MKEKLVKTVRMDRNGMMRHLFAVLWSKKMNWIWRPVEQYLMRFEISWWTPYTIRLIPHKLQLFLQFWMIPEAIKKWRNRSERRQIGITENKLYFWMKERRSGSTIHNISKATAIEVSTGMWVTKSILKRVGGHRRARDLITLNVTLQQRVI